MNLGHNNLLIQKKGKTEQACGPPQGYGDMGRLGTQKQQIPGTSLRRCWLLVCILEAAGIVCFRKKCI